MEILKLDTRLTNAHGLLSNCGVKIESVQRSLQQIVIIASLPACCYNP